MLRPLLVGLVAAACPALSAAAAPATPDEAARLTGVFERYVGVAAAGEAPRATVTPRGDDYLVDVDLKRALAGLDAFGVGIDAYTVSMVLTPAPDGTWRVRNDDTAPLVIHAGAETVRLAVKTEAFDGTFDPKLGSFSAFKLDQTGVSEARDGPTASQSRTIDNATLTGRGVPADGGTVTTTTQSVAAGTRVDVLAHSSAPPPPSTNPAVPPPPQAGTALVFAAPSVRGDMMVDRLNASKVLDLLAFLAAHPSRDSVVAAQDDLKALLGAGLPYLAGARQAASLDGFSVETPVGLFTARSAGFGVDLSGLDATGRASLAVSAADLAVPSGTLPPWSSGLVPTALDLHLGIDGFHAAEAGKALVADVDLRKDVVITPEQKEAVGRLFWPGTGTVTLGPSHIVTKMLDVAVDGRAAVGPQPSGQVTVTAKGLDQEIAALQARATDDPGAGQVLGPLALAKGLARPGPDGALSWVIAFGNGPVTVNGAPLQ